MKNFSFKFIISNTYVLWNIFYFEKNIFKWQFFLLNNKMIVFMVAEKPSLAQSISKILSNNQMSSRKGFNNACSVHEWTGKFLNSVCKFKMTSVCGHVMSLDFIPKYNNWDKIDPVIDFFIIYPKTSYSIPIASYFLFSSVRLSGVLFTTGYHFFRWC